MIYLLPPLISLAIGYLALRLILQRNAPPLALLIFLGASAGMAFSAFIVFSSLMILGKLVAGYVIAAHLVVLGLLTFALTRIIPPGQRFPVKGLKRSDFLGLAVLALFIVPVVVHASLYPQGGWDAWSCWNLKARFIFLGGENWKNMFDPILWPSNIAYPFLVPALNVWSWCFGQEPTWTVPLANSCLITFVTAGTLLFSLKKLAGRLHAILAPAWFLSMLFIVKLASSQYSDLMVGNYFLMAVVAFLYFEKTGGRSWLAVMALALGALSFTKSEGLVLAAVTIAVAVVLRALDEKKKAALSKDALVFFGALAIAFLPTLIFQIFYAPNGHTFINGFASPDKPTSLGRLTATVLFLGKELISLKWNLFWIISAVGLLLGWIKTWRKELWIFPATIGLYLFAIVGVYWINTFFEINWWLTMTLNRILFALMPAVILWVFLALE
jgi:hypothetical protein